MGYGVSRGRKNVAVGMFSRELQHNFTHLMLRDRVPGSVNTTNRRENKARQSSEEDCQVGLGE